MSSMWVVMDSIKLQTSILHQAKYQLDPSTGSKDTGFKNINQKLNILSNADANVDADAEAHSDAHADAEVTAIVVPVLTHRRAINGRKRR